MSALDIAIYLIALAALVGAGWRARKLWRALRGDDYRSHNDRRQAWLAICDGRPEPATPGTDSSLLLDCIAVYGDCEELDRLRDAINQHRKEKPQP